MKPTEKKEALQNALHHFGFRKELIITTINGGNNTKFAIGYINETGGINTCTNFMNYNELNTYMVAYYNGRNFDKINPISNLY